MSCMQVASSTWMSLFARLENKTQLLKQMEEDGNYYQVWNIQSGCSSISSWFLFLAPKYNLWIVH